MLGYHLPMFDVLAYLYETYWRPDACPEAGQLVKKLSAVGFETEEINDALAWLDGLQSISHNLSASPTATCSTRSGPPNLAAS